MLISRSPPTLPVILTLPLNGFNALNPENLDINHPLELQHNGFTNRTGRQYIGYLWFEPSTDLFQKFLVAYTLVTTCRSKPMCSKMFTRNMSPSRVGSFHAWIMCLQLREIVHTTPHMWRIYGSLAHQRYSDVTWAWIGTFVRGGLKYGKGRYIQPYLYFCTPNVSFTL